MWKRQCMEVDLTAPPDVVTGCHWSFLLGIFDRQPTWVYEPSLTPGTKLCCWRSRRSLLGDVFIGGSLHAPNLFWVYSLHASTACFCLSHHYGCFYPDSLMAKNIQNSRTPQKISITGSIYNSRRDSLCTYTHWPIIISAEKVEFLTLDPYGSVVSPSLRSSHAHPPTCPVPWELRLDLLGISDVLGGEQMWKDVRCEKTWRWNWETHL